MKSQLAYKLTSNNAQQTMNKYFTTIMMILSLWIGAAAQNIGIGTTTPGALLDVAGDAFINGVIVGRGAGNINSNTVLGNSAMNANTTGFRNIAVGLGSLNKNITGSYNVANGSFALIDNTSGMYNTAIGDDALNRNTTGVFNTGLGSSALYFATTGIENTALGSFTGLNITSGNRNTFIGSYANASGNLENASAIGNRALVGASNAIVLGSINGVNGAAANTNVGIGTTTPQARLDVAADILVNDLTIGRGAGNIVDNTAIGFNALLLNTTGSRNVAMGLGSLESNTIGSFNVANGSFSLHNNTSGTYNIAIGDDAMNTNTTGGYNTGLGANALLYSSTGIDNVALGFSSGSINVSGNRNTFLGTRANPTSGNLENASAIGNRAAVGASNAMVLGSILGVNGAQSNTSVGIGTTTPQARLDVAADIRVNELTIGRGGGNVADNTAFGINTLLLNTTGNRNVAMGLGSLQKNTLGSFNVANGSFTLYNNSSGTYNVAIGDDAMNQNTTGVANVAIGYKALMLNTSGVDNIGVGVHAGSNNTTGSTNIFIGANANSSGGEMSNAIAIGNRAMVQASNSMVLGSINGVNGAAANTNVGIGTTTPTARLDVAGTFNASGWKTASMTSNGYAEMGGVLLQWGIVNYNSNAVVTVTFPETFTTVFSVTATVDAGNNSGSGANVPVKVLNVGINTFQLAGTVVFSGDTVSKIRWMAVGI